MKRVKEIGNFENKKITGSIFNINGLKNKLYGSTNSKGIVPRNNSRYNLRNNIKVNTSMSKYYQ